MVRMPYLAGAVKARSQSGKRLDHGAAVIALDGVEGVHAGQGARPAQVLLQDVPQVRHVERILVILKPRHGHQLKKTPQVYVCV